MSTGSKLMFILIKIDYFLMEKDIREFLIVMGIRGIMTMLGFRKTTGS